MRKIVVGLTGAAGVGKSAFARDLIRNHGFRRLSLADPLKLMIRAVLASWGYNTAAQDYWIEGDGKERPCPALAYRTPRLAMQLLGTEYGREGLDGDVWINHLVKRIEANSASRIVVDDVRFDNEAEAIITRLDGCNFVIVGKDGKRPRRDPGDHASEKGVNPNFLDATLVNDFTFEGVSEQVREVLLPTIEKVYTNAA